jgi:hypothetical protein
VLKVHKKEGEGRAGVKKYKSNKFPFDFQYTSVKIAELFEQCWR